MTTDYSNSSTHTWYKRNAEFSMSSSAVLALLFTPILFFLWLLAAPAGETARLWTDDIALCVGAGFASIACLLAARRYGNTSMGRAWAILCLGMLAMTFGEVAWGVQELGLNQEVNSPAIADIGYLAFYPIVFLGLFSMPQAPVRGVRRVRLALDIAICIGALVLVSSHFVIQAMLREGTGSWQSQAIAVTYPIGDVAIVFATIVLAMRGRNRSSIGMIVLALGFLSIAVSDSLFTYLTQVGDYYSGSLIDTGWMLGYCLIAMAGLLTSSRTLDIDTYKEDVDEHVPFWQTIALQAAIVPVAATMFLDISGSTARVDLLILTGFIVLAMLASLRQAITHRENDRLNRQLETMTSDLQLKLQTDRMHSMLGIAPEPAPEAPTATALARESAAEAATTSAPQAAEPEGEFVRPNFGEASSRFDKGRYLGED